MVPRVTFRTTRIIRAVYALTVFLSAFLLFQVQPLLGKFILPWFGGTPAVWSTCMLFFQLALFGGYAYAHGLGRWSGRVQFVVHAILLLIAVSVLPIAPSIDWKPKGDEPPILLIVALLAATVGIPYFALSSTGPLLQAWYLRIDTNRSPYRLYALSNTGSLLALVSYPFVVEPSLPLGIQAWGWSWGFAVFVVLCLICGGGQWRMATWRREEGDGIVLAGPDEGRASVGPTWLDRLTWFAMSGIASVLLLAVTNQVCQDVAAVPFLWIVPLTIYLLTFIFCFERDGWYRRGPYAGMMGGTIAAVALILTHGAYVPLIGQAAVYFVALFVCCMVCHGELAALRPHPRYLTAYYLTMSGGGAAGGVFVNLIAPWIFPSYLELHLGFLACVAGLLWTCRRDPCSRLYRGKSQVAWFGATLACFWLGLLLGKDVVATVLNSDAISRGFFGVIRIVEQEAPRNNERLRMMVHGRIVHGLQFLGDESRTRPTSYYHPTSGIGRAIQSRQRLGPIHLGMVGLGTGTIATYGRPGDHFRFYEINPDVVRLARTAFTFLADSAAECEVLTVDGRLGLERESPHAYDILAVDAFSGDAIPTHLLTREALLIYRRQLKPNGILAIHYSNLHFDLEPVLAGIARGSGMVGVRVLSPADEAQGVREAHWALFSSDPAALRAPPIVDASRPFGDRVLEWTDDRNNLFEVLR